MALGWIVLALTPVSVIWNGYVLSILWGWFFVPALGLPPLSIPASNNRVPGTSATCHQQK